MGLVSDPTPLRITTTKMKPEILRLAVFGILATDPFLSGQSVLDHRGSQRCLVLPTFSTFCWCRHCCRILPIACHLRRWRLNLSDCHSSRIAVGRRKSQFSIGRETSTRHSGQETANVQFCHMIVELDGGLIGSKYQCPWFVLRTERGGCRCRLPQIVVGKCRRGTCDRWRESATEVEERYLIVR